MNLSTNTNYASVLSMFRPVDEHVVYCRNSTKASKYHPGAVSMYYRERLHSKFMKDTNPNCNPWYPTSYTHGNFNTKRVFLIRFSLQMRWVYKQKDEELHRRYEKHVRETLKWEDYGLPYMVAQWRLVGILKHYTSIPVAAWLVLTGLDCEDKILRNRLPMSVSGLLDTGFDAKKMPPRLVEPDMFEDFADTYYPEAESKYDDSTVYVCHIDEISHFHLMSH